jgi:hypothetical protein
MEQYKTESWLRAEYVDKKRTANDIAKEVCRDAKTIWSWLKKFNIPTRPRGGDSSSGSFKKGQTRPAGWKHSEETKKKLKEMAIADGRLPWGKSNEPYWRGKTGEQHPSYKGGLTPERQSVYSSTEWVEAVKAVWSRDNATCQCCGKHHNTTEARGTFHIHHIVSFQVKELRTEPSNLVLLCKDCHKFIHSKKNVNKQFIKESKNVS